MKVFPMLALKKAFTVIALTVSLLAVSPPAHAQAQGGFWSAIVSGWDSVVEAFEEVKAWLRAKLTPSHGKPSGGRAGVPELDPGAAGSAVVLLLGGIAYIASRRREEEVGG